MYVMMLAFNNLCLQYVEVTFYQVCPSPTKSMSQVILVANLFSYLYHQVARSLSIIFNIIFTYTLLGLKTSFHALMACAIVFLGFIFGSYGEINFSMQGIIYGVASSAFVALYGIYVKKTLPILDNNQWYLILLYALSLNLTRIKQQFSLLGAFSTTIPDSRYYYFFRWCYFRANCKIFIWISTFWMKSVSGFL